MALNRVYRSEGGNISMDSLLIDHKAFPFKDETVIPMTVKEKRYEKISTDSTVPIVAANTYRSNNFQWTVKGVFDGSMYDLNNTYLLLNVTTSGATETDYGLSQFACNNIITDVFVYLDSSLVSEPHVQLYPYSAFVKDILLMKRPQCVGYTGDNVAGTGMDIHCEEDSLESGNFLANPTQQIVQPAAGTQLSSSAYSVQFVNNNTFQLKINIKDGVFLTSKYFPASKNFKITLSLNLDNLFQYTTNRPDITVNSFDLMLRRVFLHDESRVAFNKAILEKPLNYNLVYSRIESIPFNAGQTSFNQTQLFSSDKFDPELLVIFSILDTSATIANNRWSLPQCGVGRGQGANIVSNRRALNITDAYLSFTGHRFPHATTGKGYIGNSMTSYQEYKKNCLIDDECYLSFGHWLSHYSPFVINMRDDQNKIWNLREREGMGRGIDLYLQFDAAPVAGTLYIVALSNVRLEMDSSKITRIGYTN